MQTSCFGIELQGPEVHQRDTSYLHSSSFVEEAEVCEILWDENFSNSRKEHSWQWGIWAKNRQSVHIYKQIPRSEEEDRFLYRNHTSISHVLKHFELSRRYFFFMCVSKPISWKTEASHLTDDSCLDKFTTSIFLGMYNFAKQQTSESQQMKSVFHFCWIWEE